MELKLIQSPQEDVTSLSEFTNPGNLSEEAQELIIYQRSKGRGRNPYARDNVALQFENVFHLIGGVPRLALWADKNPTQFYALFSKLLPAAIKAEVNVVDKDSLKSLTTDELKLMLLQSAAQDATDSK